MQNKHTAQQQQKNPLFYNSWNKLSVFVQKAKAFTRFREDF